MTVSNSKGATNKTTEPSGSVVIRKTSRLIANNLDLLDAERTEKFCRYQIHLRFYHTRYRDSWWYAASAANEIDDDGEIRGIWFKRNQEPDNDRPQSVRYGCAVYSLFFETERDQERAYTVLSTFKLANPTPEGFSG